MFSKTEGNFKLTCLEFGGAYLMLENQGMASDSEKSVAQNPTILRFNVKNLEGTYRKILTYDNEATLINNDWGNIVRCIDPDGNPISVRASSGFLDV